MRSEPQKSPSKRLRNAVERLIAGGRKRVSGVAANQSSIGGLIAGQHADGSQQAEEVRGRQKFNNLAIAQSTVDQILTGIDMDGSVEAEAAYVASLEGMAGQHLWGKEREDCRFHVRDPEQPYTKGLQKLSGDEQRTQVDSVVFGRDIDQYDEHDDPFWVRLEAFKGAFGGVSGKNFKEFGNSKRRYPDAPVSKSVVDEVILGHDLDKSASNSHDWIKSMDDHAGMSSWNHVDEFGRFTGVTCKDAEGAHRRGKKLYAGCVNKVSHVDKVAFNHEIDEVFEDPSLEDYKTKLTDGYAGRPCWDHCNDRDRYFAKGNDLSNIMGRRRYVDAPMQQTIIQKVQFGHELESRPEAGAHRWSQVVGGHAGNPGNRRSDMRHGRYHLDLEHGDGYVPGRRKVHGHRDHDSTFADLAFDDDSQVSSVHAGRPELRIRSVDVPEDATQSRAAFQPPSRRDLQRAGRRGEKNKMLVATHVGEGVASALGGRGTSEARSSPQRQRKPKSSHPAVGPKGPSIYDRDFVQISKKDLLRAAFETGYGPEIETPERPCSAPWGTQASSLGSRASMRTSHTGKSRESQSAPALATVQQPQSQAQSMLQATSRSTPRGSMRGSPQGSRGSGGETPRESAGRARQSLRNSRGSVRCSQHGSAGSRSERSVRIASQRGGGTARRSTARSRP